MRASASPRVPADPATQPEDQLAILTDCWPAQQAADDVLSDLAFAVWNGHSKSRLSNSLTPAACGRPNDVSYVPTCLLSA